MFLAYMHMGLWTLTLHLGFFGMVTAGGMFSTLWMQTATDLKIAFYQPPGPLYKCVHGHTLCDDVQPRGSAPVIA